MKDKINTVGIVVSVYNEEDGLLSFWKELNKTLSNIPDYSFTVLFVNDGSSDKSQLLIEEIIANQDEANIKIKGIEFSRNYGHEAAMLAGIDHSNDEAVICIDSDLQHPPSLIPEMLKKYEEGNNIISMIRSIRHDNSYVKNSFSGLFYKFLNSLSDYEFEPSASDFFLINKEVIHILKNNFREHHRFLRGYIQSLGFKKTTICYEAPERIYGESKYSYKKLISLAATAIFTFSQKPLRLSVFISFIFFFFTISVSIYSIVQFFTGDSPPSGYTTLIVFMSVCFSMLFILIAILSIYFGKALDEIRERPLYIIKKVI